ncbi:MAG: hypothetical protein HQL81_04455 [Magnetococcales bacterium]|nr:hypothetical protein [Magnetococcales bacterium]
MTTTTVPVNTTRTDVNQPILANFGISISEHGDLVLPIGKSSNPLIDSNNNKVTKLVINSLPEHGNIKKNGIPLKVSDEMIISEINNGDIVFSPGDHWQGEDTMIVTAFIGDQGFEQKTTVTFSIPTTEEDTLRAMRNNLIEHRKEIPWGDWNRYCVGNSSKEDRLVLSESASYALYSLTIPIRGENIEENKNQFHKIWQWTKNNLMRSNVIKVYDWQADSKIVPSSPPEQNWISNPYNDSLFHWRWHKSFFDGNRPDDISGIIYQTKDMAKDPNPTQCSSKAYTGWHDGSQVASDGDLMIAYALLLAVDRGWDSDGTLADDAKKILNALSNRVARPFHAGEMLNGHYKMFAGYQYSGVFCDKKEDPSNRSYEGLNKHLEVDCTLNNNQLGNKIRIDITDNDELLLSGNSNYYGISFPTPLDLSDIDKINMRLKGLLNFPFYFRLTARDKYENAKELTITTQPIQVDSDWKSYSFSKGDFMPDKLFDINNFDWKYVKNFFFQTESSIDNLHSMSNGPYDSDVTSFMNKEIKDGTIRFHGKNGNIVFDFKTALDLSQLRSLIIKAKGKGKFEVLLRTTENGIHSANYTSNMITANNISQRFEINKSSFMRLGENKNTEFQWGKISSIILQVNNEEADISLEEIITNFDGVQNTIISVNPVVSLGSVEFILNRNQSNDTAGTHYFSSDQGTTEINPSYFILNAYKRIGDFYKPTEPDVAQFWYDVLEQSIKDVELSLKTKFTADGAEIGNNGSLMPKSFKIDPLTGTLMAYPLGKETIYGYDSFRTLWFLIDYAHRSDAETKKRIQSLLEKSATFFMNEYKNRGTIYPEYCLDGKHFIDAKPPICRDDHTDQETVNTSFGLLSVYQSLFRFFGNQQNADAAHLADSINQSFSTDGLAKNDGDGTPGQRRYWIVNNQEEGNDKEYFMNYWGFFGRYLDCRLKNKCQ